MKLTITARIFLALTVVSVFVVILNAGVTRWNFQRGFLQYVSLQEEETIATAASSLAELYAVDGNWETLRDSPRRWNELLRQSGRPHASAQRPERPPEHNPRPRPDRRPPQGPPPHDPLDLGRRISLVDANGNLVAGMARRDAGNREVPVNVADNIVGYVVIAEQRQLTDQIDRNFAKEQERSNYLIAAAALLLAAGISAVLARQLTQPIRALAAGTRSVTAGLYDTRITAGRGDELGDLARDFNELSSTLEKNRLSRQQWVADIAHELRTPLAILRGELDAIEDGVRRFDDTTRKSLQAEIARLSKLVGDLHDLSIYDEGGLSDRHARVDIVGLLNDALQNAENRLLDGQIQLTRRLPATGVTVMADESRISQLFTNLLENTLRYTDKPGKLCVVCERNQDLVRIDFADSPPGVPADTLERLFDRLFRAEPSRSRDTGGSGLGLSICRAIVETHGGDIEATHSELGGLQIRVMLPVAGGRKAE